MASARDIIDRGIADFEAVVEALGFEPKRGNRAACVVCGASNSTTFSFDPGEGVWNCFKCNQSGGVLDLVQAVHGGSRRDSLRWLADHLGTTLDDRKLPAAERRAYAERRRRAEEQARELADWRDTYLDALLQRRNFLWDRGRQACALGLRLLREGADDRPLWKQVWRHALDDLEGDEVDAERERVRAMGPRELIAFRQSLAEGKKVAAA